MNTSDIIKLAKGHTGNGAPMDSSAILCNFEADKAVQEGRDKDARSWAIKSLRYTVGCFHADCQAAQAARDAIEEAA